MGDTKWRIYSRVYTNNVCALYVLAAAAAVFAAVASSQFVHRFCNLFNNNGNDSNGNGDDIESNEIGIEHQWKWLKEGSNFVYIYNIQIYITRIVYSTKWISSMLKEFSFKKTIHKQIELNKVGNVEMKAAKYNQWKRERVFDCECLRREWWRMHTLT